MPLTADASAAGNLLDFMLPDTMVMQDGFNENFDIGFDGGVPVAETPGRSNAYTGELRKLTVDLGPVGQARARQ